MPLLSSTPYWPSASSSASRYFKSCPTAAITSAGLAPTVGRIRPLATPVAATAAVAVAEALALALVKVVALARLVRLVAPGALDKPDTLDTLRRLDTLGTLESLDTLGVLTEREVGREEGEGSVASVESADMGMLGNSLASAESAALKSETGSEGTTVTAGIEGVSVVGRPGSATERLGCSVQGIAIGMDSERATGMEVTPRGRSVETSSGCVGIAVTAGNEGASAVGRPGSATERDG